MLKQGLALFALVSAVGAGGYSWLSATPVEVGRAVVGSAVESVYATGTIEPDQKIELRARIPGTVVRVLVDEGQWVEAGQLLAELENETLRYDLARSRTDLQAAVERADGASGPLTALRAQRESIAADLQAAKADSDRGESLIGAGAITAVELDHRHERLHKLRSEWAAADARLRGAEVDLPAERDHLRAMKNALHAQNDDRLVRAPIAGRLMQKRTEVGETVSAAQPLFVMGSDRLRLQAKVDEADIDRVAVGQSVAVRLFAFEDHVLSGEVISIRPDANRDSKTFTAKIELTAAPSGLRSGMSGEANIVVARHAGAVLVPAAALLPNAQVMVVDTGHAVARPVVVGLRDPKQVEIVSGVRPGEQVLIGDLELSSGTRIVAHEAVAPPARATTHLSMR